MTTVRRALEIQGWPDTLSPAGPDRVRIAARPGHPRTMGPVSVASPPPPVLAPPQAELTFLFRHAVLRDAAYQLQLPGDRARLHRLAFELIEAKCGGRPPAGAPLAYGTRESWVPHASDPFALELATHAALADPAPRGALHDAERLYLHRGAQLAERAYRLDAARAAWLRLAGLSSGAERAQAVGKAGHAASLAGRHTVAEPLYSQALGEFRALGDAHSVGRVLASLSLLFKETGRVADSGRAAAEACDIFRACGDRRLEGILLGHQGELLRIAGKPQEAEELLTEALDRHREFGLRAEEAATMAVIAGIRSAQGRREEAERLVQAALAIHREVGDRRSEANTLDMTARICMEAGRVEESVANFRAALELHRASGNRRAEALALSALADVGAAAGRAGEAEALYRQAIEIAREIGNRRSAGASLCGLATLCVQRGRLLDARDAWVEGHALLRSTGDGVLADRHAAAMRKACAAAGIAGLDAGGPPGKDQDRPPSERDARFGVPLA